jgi:RimJ/RimL family protein N-acetyltransferase
MEITLLPNLPENPYLKLFDAVKIGSSEQGDRVFDIYLGLTESVVAELQRHSLNTSDSDLRKNTSDYERFGVGSYEEWYSKKRVPFALIDAGSGSLAALVWFGPKSLGQKSLKHISSQEVEHEKDSGTWHTIAFRSYPPFRGTGIMKDFVRSVTDVYLHYFPDARLWTSNNRANAASVKLSEKLGYKIDESLSDEETVTMIR